MTALGPLSVDDVVVDDTPTEELPVVPPSAVPVDGTFPTVVVPPGTMPPMVQLPPSRWSTWVAGVGAAAAAGSARFDELSADASVAARRARANTVRHAAVAGQATWNGFVALLAGALAIVFGTLTWVFRHSHRFLRLAVVVGMLVIVYRAVPWGRIGDTADGVVRHVQGWSTTTTTSTSTTTTTEDPNQYDAMVPYDSGDVGDAGSGSSDSSGSGQDTYDVPTTTEDPYEYNDISTGGGQRVETVRPGQATYRTPTSTVPGN